MLSEDNLHNLYKSNYMQNPFNILTQENLERLEKHCKKAIHYEKGNLKEEHETVLELLYRYQELETNNKKLIEKLEEDMSKYKWALNEYDCTISDYKQSQAVGAWIALQKILEIAKGEKE